MGKGGGALMRQASAIEANFFTGSGDTGRRRQHASYAQPKGGRVESEPASHHRLRRVARTYICCRAPRSSGRRAPPPRPPCALCRRRRRRCAAVLVTAAPVLVAGAWRCQTALLDFQSSCVYGDEAISVHLDDSVRRDAGAGRPDLPGTRRRLAACSSSASSATSFLGPPPPYSTTEGAGAAQAPENG
jgi:hypothetical protein